MAKCKVFRLIVLLSFTNTFSIDAFHPGHRIICDNGCSEIVNKPDPGCSALYVEPCSIIHTIQTTNRVANAIEKAHTAGEYTNVLTGVNHSFFSPNNTFGFRPIVLSQNGKILAHQWDNHVLGTTISKAYANFGWLSIDNEAIMSKIKASLGWIRLAWQFENVYNEDVSWLWYFSEAYSPNLNSTVYVGTPLLEKVRAEDESCSFQHTDMCTIDSAKRSLGQVLLWLLQTQDIVEFQNVLAKIVQGGDSQLWSMEPFVFRFDNESRGECVAFTNHPEHVGKNITEMWSEANGKAYFSAKNNRSLHQDFVTAARKGGGWVKYTHNLPDSEGAETEVRAALVMGFQCELLDRATQSQKFYIGVSFSHKMGEVAMASNCQGCTGVYGEPCAVQNVRTLLGFSFVEFYVSTWEEISQKINYDPQFRMGPLYVFVININTRIIEAHGGNPSFSGHTAEYIFNQTFRQPELGTIAVDALIKEATTSKHGWAEYVFKLAASDVQIDKVSYTMFVYQDGREMLVSSGFSKTRVPEQLPCSVNYGWTTCSEINTKAVVGAVVSNLVGAKTTDQVSELFEDIAASTYTAESGFYPFVLDSDGSIIAHGVMGAPQTMDWSVILKALQITSISQEGMKDLITSTPNFNGQWYSIPWGGYRQVISEVMMYVYSLSITLSLDESSSGESIRYYVASYFVNEPHPALCGSCPENGNISCALGQADTSIASEGFCQCDPYHTTEIAFGQISNCSVIAESSMQCILNAPECSVEYLRYEIHSCSMRNKRKVHFWWEPEVDGICTAGLELPTVEYISCTSVPWFSRVGIASTIISGSGVIFNMLTFILIIVFRKREPIKIAQPLSCTTLCVGGILLNLSALLQLGVFDVKCCTVRFICFNFAACMIVSALFSKVYRVYQVYMNKSLKKVQMNNSVVLTMIVKALIADSVLFCISLGVYPPTVLSVNMKMEYFSYEMLKCSTDVLNPFSLLSLGFKCGLLVVCCILSYKVRKVDARFNDVTSIFLTVYNFAIAMTFEYFIVHAFQMDKSFYVIVHATAIWWSTCISVAILVVPKTYYIFYTSIIVKSKSLTPEENVIGGDTPIFEEELHQASNSSASRKEIITISSVKEFPKGITLEGDSNNRKTSSRTSARNDGNDFVSLKRLPSKEVLFST